MRRTFCESMLKMVEGDETFFLRLVFRNEATFSLCGTVNYHNVHIWGTHHLHETVEHPRGSSKVNVFCAVTQEKIHDPFFFEGNTAIEQSYLEMLQNWLLTLLQADSNDFIFQQDGAPPHWHLGV